MNGDEATATDVSNIGVVPPTAAAMQGYEYFVIALFVLIGSIIVMNVALIYICWYSPYFSTKRAIDNNTSSTPNNLYFLGQTMTSDDNAITDYMHIDDSRPLSVGAWSNGEEIRDLSSDTLDEEEEEQDEDTDDGETDTEESDPLVKNVMKQFNEPKLIVNDNMNINVKHEKLFNADINTNVNPLLVDQVQP